MSEHFCGSCNRLRITADGNLKVLVSCLLHSVLKAWGDKEHKTLLRYNLAPQKLQRLPTSPKTQVKTLFLSLSTHDKAIERKKIFPTLFTLNCKALTEYSVKFPCLCRPAANVAEHWHKARLSRQCY